MKGNFIQLPMLFLSLNFRIASGIALLAIFTSCGSREHSHGGAESEKMESKKLVNVDLSSQFPPALDFYNDLMIYSTCSLSMVLVENGGSLSGPINCTYLKSALIHFYNNYTSTSGLDLHPTKLDFDSAHSHLLIEIIKNYQVNQTYGLVFHYGYRKNSGGKLVYILSKGKQDSNNNIEYCPFEDSENGHAGVHYIALEPANGKSYRFIDQNEFTFLTEEYAQNILYKGNPLNAQDPKMAYHDPKGLLEFYDEYKAGSKLHLYINHGAVPNTATTNILHSPCFAFGNDLVFFPLDDIDYQYFGFNQFKAKGLDIGRLCPPHCKTPVTPCS